jgi:membrane-associated protease RseP (regulator of RpoE activity)
VMVLTNQQVEPQSIAVAIGAAPFIVTTASAVSGNADVGLVTIGAPADGVVTIQGDLAFIETNPSIEVVGFERVAAADPGQPLLVLTDTITEITNDEQGTASLDVDTIIEGTPVIDTDGALVALCTMVTDASGAHIELLPLADLITGSPGDTGVDSGTTTSTSTPATSPDDTADGWLGVRLHASPSDGSLTITAVAPSSPADTAGLLVGDQIIAIDDVPIATIDDVFQLITGKQPGTVVDITVLRMAPTDTSVTTSSPSSSTPAGATVERTVSVTLGAYEPSV